MKACIVYLAQNKIASQAYGDNRHSKLIRSLELVHANYLDRFPCPVLLFHEGDFLEADQAPLRARWPLVEFQKIEFAVPDFLHNVHIPELWPEHPQPGEFTFGIGYRHMIRFYSSLIYPILKDLGYSWYMRLDDDSFIHSPIGYDVFDFMERRGHLYGYRVTAQDTVDCTRGFAETVNSWLRAENIRPTFWHESFLNHRLHRPWNRLGYYNNFHATNVDWWLQPHIHEFLQYLDRIGGGYKYRWNDLIVQSAAVQIFMTKPQVHHFADFDYEHRTLDRHGGLSFGGVYRVKGKSVHCHQTRG
jgi:alpha 1,2-mannosyltransferase